MREITPNDDVLLRVDDVVQAVRKDKDAGGSAPPPEEMSLIVDWHNSAAKSSSYIPGGPCFYRATLTTVVLDSEGI